jgi:hypothetical protein
VGPGLSLDRFRIYAIANVATFKEKLSLELAGELAKAIRAKKRSWKELSPKDLELLTTAVFKASEGVAEAIHMGKPDDGGIDVIMVDSGQRKWLIQCKHHFGDDHTEPVDTVRNILGVMSNYPSRYGMVVSTADHFSYRAEQAQSRAGELGNTVFLYDRGKLDRLLPPLLPDRPWLAITDDLEPRASLYFEERIASCGQLHLDLEDVKQ